MRKALPMVVAFLPALVAGCYSEGRYDRAGVAKSPTAAAQTAPQPTAVGKQGEWVCVPEDDISCDSANSATHRICASDGSGWGSCIAGEPNVGHPHLRSVLDRDGFQQNYGDPDSLPLETSR